MGDVFSEDFLDRIVSVNWPSRGLVTIETNLHLIVNTTPGDTTFVTGWGPGLSGPLPAMTGNLVNTIGPEFLPPLVTPKIRENTIWGWKKYTKNNDFTGGAGGYTQIDRARYDVMTDKGELASFTSSLGSGLVPFIIDFNGASDANATPRIIDGKTLHPVNTPSGVVMRTDVDFLMLELYGLNAVPGASVYFPKLLNIISSHHVDGPAVVTYDRTYGILNFLNLGKIKGEQASTSFTITVPFVAGVQSAAWNLRVATWKKEKVFNVDKQNALVDLSKAVTVNIKSTPGGGELDVPAKTLTYRIDLKTLKMTVS